MNPYLIFLLGVFFGMFVGVFLLGLMMVARETEERKHFNELNDTAQRARVAQSFECYDLPESSKQIL